jgi:hypothetical protein
MVAISAKAEDGCLPVQQFATEIDRSGARHGLRLILRIAARRDTLLSSCINAASFRAGVDFAGAIVGMRGEAFAVIARFVVKPGRTVFLIVPVRRLSGCGRDMQQPASGTRLMRKRLASRNSTEQEPIYSQSVHWPFGRSLLIYCAVNVVLVLQPVELGFDSAYFSVPPLDRVVL